MEWVNVFVMGGMGCVAIWLVFYDLMNGKDDDDDF